MSTSSTSNDNSTTSVNTPTTTSHSDNNSDKKDMLACSKLEYYIKLYLGIIFLVCGLALFLYALKQFYNPQNKVEGADTLGIATFCLIGLTIFVLSISWLILLQESKKENDKDKKLSLSKFFDLTKETVKFKSIVMGMTQGFVFGTIDNFGMSLGIDGLENLLKKKTSDTAIVAGVSNLYSSMFGSVMGACLEKALKQKTGVDNTPWWGNLVGIIFGSLFGIYLSKLLLPKKIKVM
jgi:hypothetical protein